MSRKALYQQFDPLKPLAASENDLYVDWQREMLGADDVKPRLVNAIAFSGDAPVARLFTGHRGTGKTTELYRVQDRLIKQEKVFVSFLECERWVDLNDVEPQDLFLQMVRQLVEDLKNAGVSFALDKLQGFFREWGEILASEVELKDLKLKGDVFEITSAIRSIPGQPRATLRKLLADRRPKLEDLVNREILTPAREWLKSPSNGGYQDILLIVDQLDRIPQKSLNDKGLTNHEDLFLNASNVLRALLCDVVYTIPIELAYSHCHGRLQDVYGAEIYTLPMVNVREERGLALFSKIVELRVQKAGLSIPQVFGESGLLDRLCRMSGGHPRTLFGLLRSALERATELPLDAEIISRTLKMQASDFRKGLSDEEWAALKKVRDTHKPLTGSETDHGRWMRFLRERYVYAYYGPDGDGLWYDWNPLLGEVDA